VHIRITQLFMAMAAAALLLAGIVASASARTLSTSEQSIRASWSSLEFAGGGATIRCRVTLEGSFHSMAIAKVARSLAGAVTRSIIAHPCTNGEAWADNGTESEPLGTAPNKLPFHITYESFAGTLPNIETINLLVSRFSYLIRTTVLGLTCQGRYGRAEDNITVIAARAGGGGITSLTPSATLNRASLAEQLGPNAVCPATGPFGGRTGAVTNLSTGNTITITLI
jgi:hypothetical protein